MLWGRIWTQLSHDPLFLFLFQICLLKKSKLELGFIKKELNNIDIILKTCKLLKEILQIRQDKDLILNSTNAINFKFLT